MTTVERHDEAPSGGSEGRRALLTDRFEVDVELGDLAGTSTPSGHPRLLTDPERRIGADNGMLRIRPLENPGWGRCGLSYGPFERRAGRVLMVHALNGHNASQTYYYPETRRQALRRHLGEARRLWRRRRPHHYENFAVGWFDSPNPVGPETSGNGFVMHAADGDNGELWTRFGSGPMRAALGIQNIEIVYAVVLRERGATYYAASIDGASKVGFFWRILLPLSGPGLVTVGVLAFVGSWNAYLLPLFVLQAGGAKPEGYTLPLGVAQFSTQYSANTAGILAFTSLAMIPALIFFLAMQNRIVSGLQGAVKG